MPPGGAFQPHRQLGGDRLLDLAEEGQGEVPSVAACPAQIWPGGAQRRHYLVQFAGRLMGQRDRHEQPHDPIVDFHAALKGRVPACHVTSRCDFGWVPASPRCAIPEGGLTCALQAVTDADHGI
jgi:hypothetical protein